MVPDPKPSPSELALTNLSRCAPSDHVRNVMDAYKLESDLFTIVKSLMTFTKDAYFIPSATYLKVPKTTGLTKDPLCDQIVVFIETYLPMQCDECSTPYVVDIEGGGANPISADYSLEFQIGIGTNWQ